MLTFTFETFIAKKNKTKSLCYFRRTGAIFFKEQFCHVKVQEANIDYFNKFDNKVHSLEKAKHTKHFKEKDETT